jgi:hypothetical protein
MIEEINLPANSEASGQPTLPVADHFHPRCAGLGEGHQGVTMVWHQEKQMRPPQTTTLAIEEGFENCRGAVISRELVLSARQTVQRQKPHLSVWIDP